MNNDLLEAFLCVARTKSVSQASEILFLSQPTVTHRIQSLEKELNERLFVNKNRQMTLTDAGQDFLPYAVDILNSWNRGLEKIRNRSEEPEGKLTVSMFYHASMLYGEKVVSFAEKYPMIHLSVKTLTPEDSVEQIVDRKVQLGFVRSIRHPALSYHKMKTGNFVLAVHPNHPLSKRKQIVPGDLNGEKMAFLYNGAADQKIIDQFYQEYGQASEIIMETNNFEVCKHFIMKRLGLAYLPQYTIQAELDEGSIAGIPVTLAKQPPEYDIDLVWLTENANLTLYRLFINHFTGKS
ncbi:LysR family transcriptional regulator [Paenibacillus hemerocallicola]|uniref:LysR family transcriptional regulator n=1 Tax=Paenibacillus hemerocallicola TaxID=1172614 RepID=UPI00159EBF83|nr:LysR family transcriptional regulator [Paenibacillus hemerocallicola]